MVENIAITCPHCNSSRIGIETVGHVDNGLLWLNMQCLNCQADVALQVRTDGSQAMIRLEATPPAPPAPEPTAQELLAKLQQLLAQQQQQEPLPVVVSEAPVEAAGLPDSWRLDVWSAPLRWRLITGDKSVPCEVCGERISAGTEVRWLMQDRSPTGQGQTMHPRCWAEASGLPIDR